MCVCVTRAVAVMIFVPPDAPTTIFTLLCLSQMIVGHMDESDLLPVTSPTLNIDYTVKINNIRCDTNMNRNILDDALSQFINTKIKSVTRLDEVTGRRRKAKCICYVRRTEVIHVIVKDDSSGV